jgi:hypothetical protein
MIEARRNGFFLLFAGAAIYVLSGIALERMSPGGMADFKALYYGSRCLLQHVDPYQQGAFLRTYQSEGGSFSGDSTLARSLREAITVCINLPTSLILVVPLALFRWGIAQLLWALLTTGALFTAAFLTWTTDAGASLILKGALIGSLLAGNQVLFAGGNAAGIVVGLCVIAAWCFIHERYVWPGVVCLAISLLIKPHDAGFVWLYFLLAGRTSSKRALQTLAVTAILAIPAILWVSHVAPRWPQELRSNLSQVCSRGQINDPGPTSVTDRSPAMVIDLQSDISIFEDDPHVYNPVAFLICGTLLLIWSGHTLRSPQFPEKPWLALAVIAPLTIIVTYHHPYDAKLLLLSVPACTVLWVKGGPIGAIGLLLNAAAILFTADVPLAFLKLLTSNLHADSASLVGKMEIVLLARPVPLILLVMTVFYLWVYVRHSSSLANRIPSTILK